MTKLKRKYSELSDKEIEQLCIKYDDGVKIKEIIEFFDLDLRPSELSRNLPPKKTEENCIYCNIPMEVKRTRNNYSYGIEPKCPQCNHIKYTGWSYKKCKCENCLLEEYKKLKLIRDEIVKAFPKPDNIIREEEIDVLNISKLLFLMYCMGNKKDIFSISFKNLHIDVDESVLKTFVSSLIEDDVIYIDVAKSPIECFDIKSLPPKYDFEDILFKINVSFTEESFDRICNNDYTINSFSAKDRKNALLFFMKISLAYNLNQLMIERGFGSVIFDSEKSKKLLEMVSYNDIRYLQYKQAEYALHLKHVDHLPDYRICNSISGMIYNSCLRYLSEGWTFYSPNLEYVDNTIRIFVNKILDEDISILNVRIDDIFPE
ncbi:MAG: hypothetical protein K6E27_08855 [Eubacterium sp.]|nr:hypothetical protein [Eubacterium sp.]